MDYKTFKQKVQSMSGYEIVMNMIKGLENAHVEINMDTFGSINCEAGICYGCAATNSILEITKGKPDIKKIKEQAYNHYGNHPYNVLKDTLSLQHLWFHYLYDLDHSVNDRDFLDLFEQAIDNLRSGCIAGYNAYAEGNFAMLPVPKNPLPYLDTYNWKRKLPVYREYAEWIKLQKQDTSNVKSSEEVEPVNTENLLIFSN